MIIDIFEIIITMIWLMLPAYLANPAAAVSAKVGPPGKPIDLEKCYKGHRILGDGKTYKGFFTGVIFGILVAICENLINEYWLAMSMPYFSIAAIIALPFGSMFGDALASFFKRQIGFQRGQAFPLVDQLDFVIGAWLITLIFATTWFLTNFTVEIIFAALILTPIFHLIVNIIGYKIGVSREPW
ncbi:MAG: hypothetical protein ACD_20C00251G0001 [uncultured bacterium]|nr:MAG: hypothetical protein ACD_20C00251G0001 [uncultured bacterium]HBH18838.1 hypothetical protein [Cyanobacteria bacterium UBA9579]